MIIVYDVTGRAVYRNAIKLSIGINTLDLQLNELNKGIYLFECITKNGKQNVKLIID